MQYSAYLAGNRVFECHSKLFKNTIETNKRFKELVVKKMIRSLTSLQDTTIVVMGFSCKPNTSNIWDSPTLYICEKLVVEGARVRIYDPRDTSSSDWKMFSTRFENKYSSYTTTWYRHSFRISRMQFSFYKDGRSSITLIFVTFVKVW